MAFSHVLNKQSVKSLVSGWLNNEDNFNFIGFALSPGSGCAVITIANPGVVAGAPFVDAIFHQLNCCVEWHVKEGEMVSMGTKVATITGPCEEILHGERLAAVVLSRASGIASFGKRMKKILSDVSWKGEMCMPHTLTPGFALVEEYAMMVAGLSGNKSSVVLNQCHAAAAGGVQKALKAIRSKVGTNIKLGAICANVNEAKSAAESGADLVVFDGMPLKELSAAATSVKASFPGVLVEACGPFDESNLKSHATSNVDLLTTSNLCCGHPLVEFQVTYAEQVIKSNANSVPEAVAEVAKPPPGASSGTTKQSSGPEPAKETDSPSTATASAPKRSRVDESVKQNGTPGARDLNISPSSGWSGTSPANAQMQKRPLRPQRPQQHTPQQPRPNAPRGLASVGLQPMNSGQRMMNPLNQSMRLPGMIQQPSLGNQMPGVLNTQQGNNMGLRMQMQQQRLGGNSPSLTMNQGMLGPGSGLSGGFLGGLSQQPPPQQPQQQQQGWHMMSGGPNPMLNNVNAQMRMSGPGGGGAMNTCRTCGTGNGPSMPFCRNCRSPIR